MGKKKLTTASSRPYYEFENSMTMGNRGPILLQDYSLHEDMAHFNRADSQLGTAVAKGLGVTIDEKTIAHAK